MPSELSLDIRTFSVEHVTITSPHSFDVVQKRIEEIVPKLDYGIFELVKRGKRHEVLRQLQAAAPLSIFGVRDHGALLMVAGLRRRALQYEIGNVFTATKITREHLSAAVYPPPRVLLREGDEGVVAFEYDRPASLFGQFGSYQVDQVAGQLDETLRSTLQTAAS